MTDRSSSKIYGIEKRNKWYEYKSDDVEENPETKIHIDARRPEIG